MKKATKLLGFLMALCLAGTVFTALHADAAQTSSKDELNIAMTTEPTNFDVQADSNPAATKVREQIFSRLVRVNADAEIEGDLAESWEISEDGLAITFHLRQGVKWHNGDDFNADDVIYSFARGSEVPYVTSGYDFVDYGATEKVDDYTVVLHLAYPYSTALRSLATQSVFMILHQASVEAAGDQMKYEPVGTGPYKFVSWITGDSITLEAFEDYWEGQVPIRDVIFHFVPEATQATIELETGDVDLVLDPAASDIKRMEGDASGDYQVLKFSSNHSDSLVFNYNAEIFRDIRVRKAVAYAINLDEVLLGAYGGNGYVASTFVTKDTYGFTDEFEGDAYPYKQDLEQAKSLLAEAGYPDGFAMNLLVDSDTSYRYKTAEIIQNQLGQIGITVNIRAFDTATYKSMRAAQDPAEFEAMLYGCSGLTGDADDMLWQSLESTAAGSKGYVYTHDDDQLSTEKYDELLHQARATYDDAERVAIYKEIQELAEEELPFMPTCTRGVKALASADLKGVDYYFGYLRLRGAYFE